jgi:hypothetical protein
MATETKHVIVPEINIEHSIKIKNSGQHSGGHKTVSKEMGRPPGMNV